MRSLAGVPMFFVGWLLGAALGGAGVVWLMRRAGFAAWQVAIVIAALIVAIILGSKTLYVIEVWPAWWGGPQPLAAVVLSPHMRIPGGILLAVLAGPWIARAIGVGFLRYADVVTPAAGLLMVGIRVGCFLEGCCVGRATSLPWGVRFAPGTPAHSAQVGAGLIHPRTAWSEPVHALQLYFAAAGLALFVALAARQPQKRFDGEILLLFGLGYFWSTWALEFLRALPHPLTQHTVLAAALATSAAYGLARRRAPVAG